MMQLSWLHLALSLDGCRAELQLLGDPDNTRVMEGVMRVGGPALRFAAGSPPPAGTPARSPARLMVYSQRGIATGAGVVVHTGDGSFEVSGSDQVELLQRRAHNRVTLGRPVVLEAAEPAEARAPATLVDVSVGGGRISTDAPLAQGDSVRIAMEGAAGTLRLAGRVLRSDPGEAGARQTAGLQWTGMLQPHREELKQMMQKATAQRAMEGGWNRPQAF